MHGARRRPALFAVPLLGALTVGVAALAAGVPIDLHVVDVRIRYSAFAPPAIQVPYGRPITFVIRNDDPIEHEWIVGDDVVHEVHRTGIEEHHASRPTEVSLPALSTVRTTVTFDRPLSWQFICHLPGHEAYGMIGLVTAR